MKNQESKKTTLNISIACSLKLDFIAVLADDDKTSRLFKVDQDSFLDYIAEIGLPDKYLVNIKPGLIKGEKYLSVVEYTQGTSPVELAASNFIRLSIFDFCRELTPNIVTEDIFESFIHTDYIFKVKAFDPNNTYAKANFLSWIGWEENDTNFETIDRIDLETLSDFIRNIILYDSKDITYEAVHECVSYGEKEVTIDMSRAIKKGVK